LPYQSTSRLLEDRLPAMRADSIRPMQRVVVGLPAPGLTKPLPLAFRFEELLATLELALSRREIKGHFLPPKPILKMR